MPWVSSEWQELLHLSPHPRGGVGYRCAGLRGNYAGAVCHGTETTGEDAKNVGVKETNPRRPHFVVTGESIEIGTGDRCDCDGAAKKPYIITSYSNTS